MGSTALSCSPAPGDQSAPNQQHPRAGGHLVEFQNSQGTKTLPGGTRRAPKGRAEARLEGGQGQASPWQELCVPCVPWPGLQQQLLQGWHLPSCRALPNPGSHCRDRRRGREMLLGHTPALSVPVGGVGLAQPHVPPRLSPFHVPPPPLLQLDLPWSLLCCPSQAIRSPRGRFSAGRAAWGCCPRLGIAGHSSLQVLGASIPHSLGTASSTCSVPRHGLSGAALCQSPALCLLS